MFSFIGDTVLDPFLGTGSTTLAALHANRSSIGYEIEPRYMDIVGERLSQLNVGAQVFVNTPHRKPATTPE
jgi:site-specific DNA-methyltransferase (adenine-specific)